MTRPFTCCLLCFITVKDRIYWLFSLAFAYSTSKSCSNNVITIPSCCEKHVFLGNNVTILGQLYRIKGKPLVQYVHGSYFVGCHFVRWQHKAWRNIVHSFGFRNLFISSIQKMKKNYTISTSRALMRTFWFCWQFCRNFSSLGAHLWGDNNEIWRYQGWSKWLITPFVIRLKLKLENDSVVPYFVSLLFFHE